MTNVLKPVWDQMHKDGYNAFSGTMLFRSIFDNYKGLLKDRDVLDIGCGTGDAFDWMKGFVRSYQGIDISKEVVEKINKRFSRDGKFKYALECDGVGNIPLDKVVNFNVVFSALVFQHIQKTYLNRYFEEAHRILTPYGTFLFHTTEWGHQHQGHTNYNDDPVEKDHCLSGQYSHNQEVVKKLLYDNGFKLISSMKYQDEPGLVKENAWWWVYHAEKI